MTRIKYIFYIIIVTGLLIQEGCSQSADSAKSCYSDKLPDKDIVLTRMLNKPHFEGGNNSLVSYLSTNISFEKFISDLPQNGGIYSDTGRIKFIVSKQGSLSDLSVTLAKKKMFADEIARVIKKSSCNWVAGQTE